MLFYATIAPAQDLAGVFAGFDRNSKRTINHAPWQKILRNYLFADKAGINRFKYKQVTATDRQRLKTYIGAFARTDLRSLARKQQFAYWINLYNALTVDVVLDHYPVASIRDISISPGLFAKGPWRQKLITVRGIALSLDNIEHDILRKIWRDKRIHYALNCASVGCPNLAASAYTGKNLEAMLERAAAQYINHVHGVRIRGSKATLSSIYKWYAADFGSQKQLLAHLRHYASPALKRQLGGAPAIAGYAYDWRLNE